jgi:hypothetical protein
MHHSLMRAVALASLLLTSQMTAHAAGLTPIYTIQGSGSASPLVGQTVTTSGVVTKVQTNGFFMQDLTGDGNPATSDGIFVFTSTAPTVATGQRVQFTAKVAEFNTGAATNADTAAHTVTELTTLSGLTVLGTGYSIAPTVISLPELVDDDLERYEGMLVTLTGPLTVAQNYFQARYGQLTLAAGGRLETPTNRYRPGTPQAVALADENARRRIVLDDSSSAQNPNPTPYFSASNGSILRAGDTVGSITGVIDYGLATSSNTGAGDYKIHPTVAPVLTSSNLRTAAPENVAGNVRVASFNVLNYFTTFTNGNTASGLTGQGCMLGTSVAKANCRGADSLAEFTRQRSKIIEAIAAINADALGLMEIQNNGNTAVQDLVNGLNARMGSGTYTAAALPAAGTGDDAIRVAIIYKPARLSPLAAPLSDTTAINNRPPLAQSFVAANGERFSLVVNHLKSKSSCPASSDVDYTGNFDANDGQGCWNARRLAQAQQLRSFVAQVQQASGSNDVLLVGDFNAYAQEDPVYNLTSSGLVDQIGRFNSFGYSYVFDGAAGRIDHAISTGTLSPKVASAQHWHINADEGLSLDYNLEFKQPACATCAPDPYAVSPYRSSDHDPVVLGLNLYKTITGTAGRDVLVGTPGDDILVGGAGADTLSGNGGNNLFVYQSMRDAGDVITDFVPGKDRLDLRALLASINANPATALAQGVIQWVAVGSDTQVLIDTDGSVGPALARPLLTLRGVSPAQLLGSRDLILQ